MDPKTQGVLMHTLWTSIWKMIRVGIQGVRYCTKGVSPESEIRAKRVYEHPAVWSRQTPIEGQRNGSQRFSSVLPGSRRSVYTHGACVHLVFIWCSSPISTLMHDALSTPSVSF
jgi:hypothetical protein